MKTQAMDVVRGSGNVFRDVGHENADVAQVKAILAAAIIKALDQEDLSVRGAHARTGTAAADFSRIRNADISRFTVDRLITILNRLGSRVEVKVKVRRATSAEARAAVQSEDRSPSSRAKPGALLAGVRVDVRFRGPVVSRGMVRH
jgi:predicted XRE-type DNA-binding protein